MSNNYNSDGYIMIDLSDVDVTKSTQNVPGIYSRILNVIDANKLILIVNHKGLTPQAAICNKLLNYYVITTNLYIYKINSNDIVIIEQAGSSSVEVSIIPTLMSGTKIADFAIGSVEGSLYAPEFETEINDNVTASNSTWSSEKIDGELALKADAADVYTKSQVDTALSLKANAADVYTKSQVDTALSLKADAADVYTKSQVDTALSLKANAADVYTKTEVDTKLSIGPEIAISTSAPFIEYRICGHLLFLQINTWDHAITSDETLGYIPNTITILMQGRQYTSTGLIAIDKTDGRIWARNLATYSAFLFVLPID